jgi:hypothetical protein
MSIAKGSPRLLVIDTVCSIILYPSSPFIGPSHAPPASS